MRITRQVKFILLIGVSCFFVSCFTQKRKCEGFDFDKLPSDFEVKGEIHFVNEDNDSFLFYLTARDTVVPSYEECEESMVNNCDCLSSLNLEYSLDSNIVFSMIISQSRDIKNSELAFFIDDCSSFYQRDFTVENLPQNSVSVECDLSMFKVYSMGKDFYFYSFVDSDGIKWLRK